MTCFNHPVAALALGIGLGGALLAAQPAASQNVVSQDVAVHGIADSAPGVRMISIPANHRGTDLTGMIWYPTQASAAPDRVGDNVIFIGVDAQMDAPLPVIQPGGARPLVVLSHGSGGNILGLSWLAAGLAGQGAIVVAMNHPGSTSRDSYPTQTAHLDRRTGDLSAALDHLLADPEWGGRIDRDAISVMGFSLGGGTALQIAGAQFSADAYRAFCARFAGAATGCDWMQSDGFDLNAWPVSAEGDHSDPRVSRVIAVDPAFGYSWAAGSVEGIDIPALLINLGDTSEGSEWMGVGVGPDAANLPAQMPRATYSVIDAAWHFSFLPECRFYAPLLVWFEGEEPVCSDPWGSNRASVHAQIVTQAARFLGLADPLG